eukprot:scaffold9176_cov129-Cylindrotheca_fusiformis.AAC.18
MDVVESREIRKHLAQSFRNCLLSELYLSHAARKNIQKDENKPSTNRVDIKSTIHVLEGANSRDLVPRVDNCWRTPLGPHQYYVNEIRRRWDRTHLFEVVDRHDGYNYQQLCDWGKVMLMEKQERTLMEAIHKTNGMACGGELTRGILSIPPQIGGCDKEGHDGRTWTLRLVKYHGFLEHTTNFEATLHQRYHFPNQTSFEMTERSLEVANSDSVKTLSEAEIPVLPFAVSLPKAALQSRDSSPLEKTVVGDKGIVGTIVLLTNSVMVWVGWGTIHVDAPDSESKELSATFGIGSGNPPQGQCLVAMPRTGYRGAFGTDSREAPCSQLIASASSDDQMLAAQMASRLSTRASMAVIVSCQLSLSIGNEADEWHTLETNALSHRAAAMAEKEVWRILQTRVLFTA